ncbi:MAG: hypothetical protein HOP09_07780 [Hyphomicrobium sp.]|nr:hypothetical protein [Hyphomicrobium sp.]
MRLPSPPRIVVVSREDKEAKLRDFIAQALAARRGEPVQAFGEIFTLIARAPDSPAAQAVLAMAPEIAAANIAIRVVLFETEPMSEDTVQASLLDVTAIDMRMMADQRFAAAHEQLSLGRDRVWIGDCMRRDPIKRDAFEMYHEAHAPAAGHADASFLKMWDRSVPLSRVMPSAVSANVILAAQPATGPDGATTRS